MPKITDGLNDRPEDGTTAQSRPGLPDVSSKPIKASDEEAPRVRAKLDGDACDKLKKEIYEQIEKPQSGSA